MLLVFLTTLVSCGVSDNPGPAAAAPPVPTALDQLAEGWTVVAPLTAQAASNQAERLARIQRWPKEVSSEARTFTERGGASLSLRYYLFKPRDYVPAKAYPMVLSLHGGKPKRYEHLLEGGDLGFAYGVGRLVSPEEQARHPTFVVVPWSEGRGWLDDNLRLVRGLLDVLRREFPVDTTRIYVTGQSMGGYGTWSILTKYPEFFAAAIPICGGGDPTQAVRLKRIPVWDFHGTADGVVPVSESRNMINALLRVGGQPIYWEYQGASHAQTAERAYCEPQLLEWLFAQQKS